MVVHENSWEKVAVRVDNPPPDRYPCACRGREGPSPGEEIMPNIGDKIVGRDLSGMTRTGTVIEFVFGWCKIQNGNLTHMVDFRSMA